MMRNIVQITWKLPDTTNVEVWFDLMEVPMNFINNIDGFIESVKADFPSRKVRLVQLMGGDNAKS